MRVFRAGPKQLRISSLYDRRTSSAYGQAPQPFSSLIQVFLPLATIITVMAVGRRPVGRPPKFQYLEVTEIDILPHFGREPIFYNREDVVVTGHQLMVGGGVDHNQPGYVYFIREDGTNYIKVGLTTDPRSRRRNLQTGNPRILKMNFKEVPNMLVAERMLKDAMEKEGRKSKGGTEWFHVSNVDSAEKAFMRCVR